MSIERLLLATTLPSACRDRIAWVSPSCASVQPGAAYFSIAVIRQAKGPVSPKVHDSRYSNPLIHPRAWPAYVVSNKAVAEAAWTQHTASNDVSLHRMSKTQRMLMNTNVSDLRSQPDTQRRTSRYQYLTDTNAGTPAGELLRRYWQPVALASELPPGGAPVGVRIMGDDIVLFRDDADRVGALDRKCKHRCADLVLARIEDGGIRCPYHGWLFAIDGRVLDQPAEVSRTAKDRVRARSYPVHEAGGAFWLYLGPGEPPLFPNYPALQGSDEHRYTCKWFGDCNWMQASEGNIDPVHTSYLHQLELKDDTMKARWGVFANSARPELSVAETRFGVRLFTLRDVGTNGDKSIRVTNFVMPNACAVGGFEGYLGDGGLTMLWDVPIDNQQHWRWEFIFHRSGKLEKESIEAQYRAEKGDGDRMWRTKSDNYSQDRESMKDKAYLGLGPCFSVHDVVITQSQGQIHDQSDEHLSSSDIAIVRARRALGEAAQAVANGQDPRGVVRAAAENDFRDMVVLTGVLAAGESKEACVAALERKGDLYTPQTAS
jgi:phthalate 4,5-dioxygenase oxygenase subunit